MSKYNKLVRDKIPQIIQENGEKPVFKVLNNVEYLIELNNKLNEELQEYLTDYTCEELADMLEVIYAIAKSKGLSQEGLEKIRFDKHKARGGFDKRQFLIGVE
jgi:predicted house-cleaning noncanonical NTP pyrophosphatase (MazG superfamily)